MVAPPPSDKPPLQVERTLLSWERSSIGFLAVGAMLMFRQPGPLAVGRVGLGAAAIVMALMVVWLSRVRGRRIVAARRHDATAAVPSPQTEVLVIGLATVGFAVAIVVALLVSGH